MIRIRFFGPRELNQKGVRAARYGDSDHAGCLKTRKSTTGMVLMRTASRTQSTISLSSAESEYYGIVKCAAIGLGARSMLADFGMSTDVVGPHGLVEWTGGWLTTRTWVASGMCRLVTCGYSNEHSRETFA